jgi:hypothetical protein
MAGYSGTTLAKKLGIGAGSKVLLVGEPEGYRDLLEPLPDSVEFASKLSAELGLIHCFTTKRLDLKKALDTYRRIVKPTAIVWVSWPKKAAKIATEVTDDVIRELALPIGFVDVKVCAVDEVWSGLKLVIRKELR